MRIAVLSDIHSNLVALDAVLAHMGTVDALWHLGDVVGYGPDPDAVVERLAGLGAVGVRGNHDAAAAGGPEIEYFNPDARKAMEWTIARISPATRTHLAGLPERLTIEDVSLVHGSLRDPTWEYVTTLAIARASLDLLATPVGLHGHTHVPVAFIADEGRTDVVPVEDATRLQLPDRPVLLNPGSVGQPRDGDPRAAYLVLDTEARVVTWHRVEYDIAAVMAAMHAVDLPIRLAERLRHGL
jgi:predicted phosphodiesterase